jgi:hypothetical protein
MLSIVAISIHTRFHPYSYPKVSKFHVDLGTVSSCTEPLVIAICWFLALKSLRKAPAHRIRSSSLRAIACGRGDRHERSGAANLFASSSRSE